MEIEDLKNILDKYQNYPDQGVKNDIGLLCAWLASYKGQAQGYKRACDDIREMRIRKLI